jgi:tetratricopeptide (TPR) repeat protein
MKIFAFFIGARGSKEKGLRFLRKASTGGRTYWGARLLLTVMDTREKRYESALDTLREMEEAFPRNPLFPVERGWVHLLEKDWASARSTFEKVRVKQRRDTPYFDQVPPSLVLLRLGESYLFDGRFENAVDRFEEALATPDLVETTEALLYLRRGQAYDGLDKRQEALADYRKTIRLNVDKASRRQAKRHLNEPFSLRP